MGGSADVIADMVGRGFKPGLSLAAAAKLAVKALTSDGGPNAAPRQLGVDALEVAILDRSRALPRKFRRITGDRLAALLRHEIKPKDTGTEAPPHIPPEPPIPETVLGEST
jgi:proteasome alpha subunit